MEINRQMKRKWVVYRTVWLVLGRYRACSLFGDLVFPSRHARDLKGSTFFATYHIGGISTLVSHKSTADSCTHEILQNGC